MISAVICFVKSKNSKTQRHAAAERMRSRSDQMLHRILEQSFSLPPGAIQGPESTLPQSSMPQSAMQQSSCVQTSKKKLNPKKNVKPTISSVQNIVYPVLGSDSDLESVC